MAEGRLPPQVFALSAAGGGFAGAFVAVILIWVFAGPLCCDHEDDPMSDKRPAAADVARPAESGRVGERSAFAVT